MLSSTALRRGRSALKRRPTALVALFSVLGAVLIAFVLVPVLTVILGTSPGSIAEALGEGTVRWSLWLTLYAALIATVIAFVFGVPLAYVLARKRFRGKAFIEGLIDVPIVFPHTAAGVALLMVYGQDGILGRLLAPLGITFTDSVPGIVVAMMFVSLPFLVDSAREAFALVDPRYEQVARTLGVSPGVAFLRTTLPLARRGVLAGLVMMWARGISEFGAVVILAYNPKIVPVLVYERFEGFGLDAAKPVAVIIVLVALAVFIVLRTALAPRLRVRRLRVAGAMPMPVGRSSLDGGSSDAPTDGLSQGGGSAMDGSGPAIGESTVQVIRRPGGLTVELSRLVARAGAFCTGPLDLAVRSGEYFVLLGPSGAGKTVVLETIAGLRRPAGGSVGLDGSDAASLPPERRRIGFVCQDSLLFPNLDVAGNIAFGLGAHTAAQWVSGTRRRRAAASPRVGAVAGLVGAGHLMSRDPVELSGGEQQRVALARALVTEPRLLLLDEPLANLDQETREELQTMLRRIHEHFPTTVLHVTHDFPEATVLADRCAVLGDGRLHQTGTPSEVFRRPVDAFVARFTGGRNVFSGVGTAPEDRQGALTPADGRGAGLVVATFVELPGGPRLRSATILGGRVGVLVRPEDIEIVPEGGVAPTGDDSLGRAGFNELSGAVEDILHQGGTALVRVAVPPRFTALLTRGQLEALGVQRGDRVRLRIPVAAVHLFPEGERGAETLAAPRSFA